MVRLRVLLTPLGGLSPARNADSGAVRDIRADCRSGLTTRPPGSCLQSGDEEYQADYRQQSKFQRNEDVCLGGLIESHQLRQVVLVLRGLVRKPIALMRLTISSSA